MTSGIGTALQDAIGLGLAGARGLAEGLGIVQPEQPQGMFGAPAEAQPTDLSDLNPLQQLSLRFQNATASAGGGGLAAASGALRQRRTQQNQQRLDAFSQGTKMLSDFDAIRDRAGPADYDRIDKLLKKRFGELAGGQPGEADEFYDTFMGGRGLTPGLLELVQSDPGAQQILAAGGGIGDLRKYLTTPEKLAAAMHSADQRVLSPARNKLDAIGKSDRPDLRKALADRMKTAGGRPTLAMIRDLAEAGLIPDELLPTANEWAALDRNELELGDLNFQANPELLKRREEGFNSELKREEEAAKIAGEHRAKMDEIALEAILNPKRDGSQPTASRELEFAKWIENKRLPFFRSESDIQQVMDAPLNGFGDLQALYGFVKNQDNTAAREGELALAQTAASVADRIQNVMKNVGAGRKLSDKQRGEIRGILEGYRAKIRSQHQGFVQRMLTTANGWSMDPERTIPGWREIMGQAQPGGAAGAQPAAAPGAAPAQVRMRFPDGAEKLVPAGDLQKWTAVGGVQVQ